MQLLFWKGKHGAYLIPEELTVDSQAFIEWTQSVDANNPKELAIMAKEPVDKSVCDNIYPPTNPTRIYESNYLEHLPEEDQAEAIKQAWESTPSVEIKR